MMRSITWLALAAAAIGLGACRCWVSNAPSGAERVALAVSEGPPHNCQPYWWNSCDALNARLATLNAPENGGYDGWAQDLVAGQKNVYTALHGLLFEELDRDLDLTYSTPVEYSELNSKTIDRPGDIVIWANAIKAGLRRDGENTTDPNHHDPAWNTKGWANPDKAHFGGNPMSFAKLVELQGRVRTALGSSMSFGGRSSRPHLYYSDR